MLSLSVLGLTMPDSRTQPTLKRKDAPVTKLASDQNALTKLQASILRMTESVSLEPVHVLTSVRSDRQPTHLQPEKHAVSFRQDTVQNAAASSASSLKKIFGSEVPTVLSAENKSESTSVPTEASPIQISDEAGDLCTLLHPRLLKPVTEKMKITSLTRVQRLCWAGMSCRTGDLMVRSETGSGKTLAYVLPLLNRLLVESETSKIDRSTGTMIVILCPTRELVEQVHSVLQVLVMNAGFVVVGCIHGGDNRHKEKARLRKGVHILVATPGRLLDHLQTTSAFGHGGLQTIVLDEADRLLDMGFEKDIHAIMSIISPKKRILVSATITAGLERLSHFALTDPERIGESEDTFEVPASLRQHFCVVSAKHKLVTLVSFLKAQLDAGSRKIVVFLSTSDAAEFIHLLLSRVKSPFASRKRAFAASGRSVASSRPRNLQRKLQMRANGHLEVDGEDQKEGVVTFDEDEVDPFERGCDEAQEALTDADGLVNVHLLKLHGNMGQVDRAAVFHSFRSSTDQGILFCTDVAARGLDMANIDWIVHYDPPTDERCYIHRVGRTARLGRVGDSILFLHPHEAKYAEYLSKFIRMPIAEKKSEAFLFYLTKLDPAANHNWVQSCATLERKICQCVREDETLSRIALFAYQSYVRAYAGFPRAVRQYFCQEELHLGHIANSFGIDAKPSELRRKMHAEKLMKDERNLGRDTSRFAKQGSRMELDVKDKYHSTMAHKQVKASKDWLEVQREKNIGVPKTATFTEFDAE